MSPTTPAFLSPVLLVSYAIFDTVNHFFSLTMHSSLGFQDITLARLSSDLFCSNFSVSVLSSSSSSWLYKFWVPSYSDLEPLLHHTHLFANLILSLSIKYWSSLAVHWLRLHASTAGGVDLIPGQGTKILQAAGCGQKKYINIICTLMMPQFLSFFFFNIFIGV